MASCKKGLARLFLDYAKPDSKGHTRLIKIDELNRFYGTDKFTTTNGGGWCRSDSPALADYVVDRPTDSAGRIVGVQLLGYKPGRADRQIAAHVREALKERPCVITASVSGNIEIDHKWGQRKYYPNYQDLEKQAPDDFQPMTRAVNIAKRVHCDDCRRKRERFDARQLGYSVPQWTGGKKFEKDCIGCYWHDPRKFNEVVSKGFKPKS